MSWISFELNPTESTVQFGNAPHRLDNMANGSHFSYPNDICGTNSTRSVHTVNMSVPQGVQVFYRVSSDGTLWSPVFNTTGLIQSKTTRTFSIFGDLAVYNVDNAAPGLTNDTREGVHDFIIHYGDTAYNMDDECGQVGDTFFNTVQSYSTQTPVVYSSGEVPTCLLLRGFCSLHHGFEFIAHKTVFPILSSLVVRYSSCNDAPSCTREP